MLFADTVPTYNAVGHELHNWTGYRLSRVQSRHGEIGNLLFYQPMMTVRPFVDMPI
jgi:hypothetical protein